MPRPSRGQLCQSCDRRWPTTRADRSESAGREPSHYQQYPSSDLYPLDQEDTGSDSDPPQSVIDGVKHDIDDAQQWVKEKEAKKKAKSARGHRSFALPGSGMYGAPPRNNLRRGSKRSGPPRSNNPNTGQNASSETAENPRKRKQPSDEPQNSRDGFFAYIKEGYDAREELSRKGKANRAKAKAKAKLQQKAGNREAANECKAGRPLFVTESDSESDVEMEGTGTGTSTDLVPTGTNAPQNDALTGLDSMSLESSRSLTTSRHPPNIFDFDSTFTIPDLWPEETSNTPDQAEAIAPPPVETPALDFGFDFDEVHWTVRGYFDRWLHNEFFKMAVAERTSTSAPNSINMEGIQFTLEMFESVLNDKPRDHIQEQWTSSQQLKTCELRIHREARCKEIRCWIKQLHPYHSLGKILQWKETSSPLLLQTLSLRSIASFYGQNSRFGNRIWPISVTASRKNFLNYNKPS